MPDNQTLRASAYTSLGTARTEQVTLPETTFDGVGFGCVVIRVDVLRAMKRPYFASHVFVDAKSRKVSQCDEDYLFCERVRAAGHRVLLHAGVRTPHYDRASGTSAPAAAKPIATMLNPIPTSTL